MHWITVMDIQFSPSCSVVFNHWGRQETMACNEFLERWSLAEETIGQSALAGRILQPFTYVCQVESEPNNPADCR